MRRLIWVSFCLLFASSLHAQSTISGQVTASDGGAPLENIQLDVLNSASEYLNSASTDINGNFTLNVPGDGDYFVFTPEFGVYAPYLPEVYPDTYCNTAEGCDFGSLVTPINLSGGASATGIDFALESGFTISGTVLDDGANPVDGLTVCIHRTDYSFTGVCGGTAPNGMYTTGSLPAGNDYVAYAIGDDLGLIRQMWNGVACAGSNCDFATGTAIDLGNPGDVTGVNFTLAPSDPGRISGFILDQNGNPTPGGAVGVFDENLDFYGHYFADENGYWETPPGATGTYYLRTDFTNDVIDDVWDGGDGAQCPNQLCNLLDSNPVNVGSGDFLTDITFILDPIDSGGTIAGRVEDLAANPLPLVEVILHNNQGNEIEYRQTDLAGNYDFGLQTDETYYVRTRTAPGGLGAELYDDVKCVPERSCDAAFIISNGSAVNVAGSDVPGIDFVLEDAAGGRITGQVTDAGNSIALANTGMQLFDEFGTDVSDTLTDAEGNYQFLGLPDGSYRVFVNGPTEGYSAELYQNVPCGDYSCDIAVEGTPVVVSSGSYEVADMALDFDPAGSRIMGTVTRSDNGEPVISNFGYMGVNIFDVDGNQVGGTSTDPGGIYQLFMPPGDYYLATDNDQGFHGLINECHNNIQCADNYNPKGEGGTLITLNPNTTLVIDFDLESLPLVGGTVNIDDGSTITAANGDIEVRVLTPTGDYVNGAGIDSNGDWSLPLADGDYLIAALPNTPGTYQQYVSEFNDGTSATYSSEGGFFSNLTDFGAITPVTISGNSTVDITLEQGVTIEGTVSDENNPGTFLTGGVVTVNSPAFDRELSFGFVRPDGSYSVVAFPAEEFILFHSGFAVGYGREIGGVNKCLRDGPNGCDDAVAASTPENPANGDALIRDLDLVRRIELSGNVLDALANPLGGARVTVRVAADGYVAAEAWTDGNGDWSVGNVAPGSYYITVRGEDFGLVGQIYNSGGSQNCPFEGCDYGALGTLVENFDGLDKGGINFALIGQTFATVTGSILDQNSEPSTGGAASFIDPFGEIYQDAWVDGNGNFAIDLPDGNYTVVTRFTFGVVDDVWDGVNGTQCLNQLCDFGALATQITVSGGAASGSPAFVLDFLPDGGKHIAGEVLDGSLNPLRETRVIFTNREGAYLTEVRTDTAGLYRSNPLGDDDYYVYTSGEEVGLARELWSGGEPNYVCSPAIECDDPAMIVSNGAPVSITGADITDINFVLDSPDPATAISGRVTGDGLVLTATGVELFDEFGNYWGGRETDVNGNYFFYGLEDDGRTYRVRVNNPPPSYGFELFNDIACPDNSCDPVGEGDPVAVGSIDIDLDLPYVGGTRFFGQVVSDDSGLGVSSSIGYMGVQLWDESFNIVATTSTDGAGRYQMVLSDYGLGPGIYYLVTEQDQAYHGLVNEDNNGTPCFADCNPQNIGTTPEIPVDGESLRVDFFLGSGVKISGFVTDAVNAANLEGVNVCAAEVANFNWLGCATTDSSGFYLIQGLESRSDVVLWTQDLGGLFYIPQVFDGRPGTRWWEGDLIDLTGGDVQIDFALERSSVISGNVSDSGTLTGISGILVDVLDEQCNPVATAETDSNGDYAVAGFAAGVFYVWTNTLDTGYIRELYPDVKQNRCDTTAANVQPFIVAAEDVFTGIDFQLDIGGTINGSIFSSVSGLLPFRSGQARLSDDNGDQVLVVRNDQPDNSYKIAGLIPGTYFLVHSSTNLGLIDEVYDDVPCPRFSCGPAPAVPLVLGPGDVLNGIDATLEPGSLIQGQITDASNGLPVAGYSLSIYTDTGDYAAFARSDENGFYSSTTGLPAGDYYLSNKFEDQFGVDFSPYMAMVYPNQTCGEACDVLSGSAVPVNGVDAVAGIDFALETGTQVVGSVTTGGTTALVGITIELLSSADGSVLRSTQSDINGDWSFPSLGSGDYFLRTRNIAGYEDELYAAISCNPFCDPLTGLAISPDGFSDNVAPVNFDLSLTPTISGVVRDESTALLGGVIVEAYDTLGGLVASAVTDAAGAYTIGNLYGGTFFVKSVNGLGFVNDLYSGSACLPGCDPTDGTPIDLSGGPVGGIDLVLGSSSTISGTVTDSQTTNPVAGITVEVYRDTGAFVGSSISSAAGEFSIGGLSSGNYHAVSRNTFGYIDEGSGGNVCQSNCAPTSTAQIVVGTNETIVRDFVLDNGGIITGQVQDSALNGLPSVAVKAYNSAGLLVGSSTTGPSGTYEIRGLAAGDVYLRTTNQSGYRNQRYNELDCDALCDVLSANPLSVTIGAQLAGIDFTLGLGGSIAGTVTGDGVPLSGVQVQAFDTVGLLAGFAVTSANGSYVIGGLDDGEYRLRTINAAGFVDVVRGGDSCSPEPCSIASGTTSTVASSNELGVDFALTAGSPISGVATDSQGIPLPGGTATLFSATGQEIKTGGVFNGSFFISGLADGTYYLLITNGSGLVDQLFNGLPCPGGSCDVTGGTPIVVGAGAPPQSLAPSANPPSIDTSNRLTFTMDRGTELSGSVKGQSDAPVQFAKVYFFDSLGNLAGEATTNGLGEFTSESSFPEGTYYAATSAPGKGGAGNGLIDEFFGDVVCLGECDPSIQLGAPIIIPGGPVSAIDIVLASGKDISGTISVLGGGTLSSATVSLFDSAGNSAGSTSSNGAGSYLFEGLAPGSYYIKATHPSDNYDAVLFDGIDCSAGCDVTTGDTIVMSNANIGLIDLALPLAPAIDIEKLTNGVNADNPGGGDAPRLLPGSAVNWTYKLINTGGSDLINVAVTDNRGVSVTCPEVTLAVGATMDCTASGAAEDLALNPYGILGKCGDQANEPMYQNTGSVTAQTGGGAIVQDADTSHYCNENVPVITCNLTEVTDKTVIGDEMFEACDSLIIGDTFTAEDGASTTLSSGTDIEFLPDFRIDNGAILDVNVCGQSLCEVSDQPMPYGCHSCVTDICDIDSSCCDSEFSLSCQMKVESVCNLACE